MVREEPVLVRLANLESHGTMAESESSLCLAHTVRQDNDQKTRPIETLSLLTITIIIIIGLLV